MTPVGALVFLAIAVACGVVGSLLAGFRLRGCAITTALAFGGAWVGAWFAGQVHLPALYLVQVHGQTFAIVWPLLGAAMFGGVASMLTGRGREGF